ncbi:hypothetical protein GC174_08635 [bacterium]|nr:hypothetical protein [bacterium]
MTWIKTIPMSQASAGLLKCIEESMRLYPAEYGTPVESLVVKDDPDQGAEIVMAHSLIPDALKHSFSFYGTLLSPELPLSRRDHELIASTVSALNDCFY